MTIDIVDKVIATAIEAEDPSFQSAILCDDFKFNSRKEVKEKWAISILQQIYL